MWHRVVFWVVALLSVSMPTNAMSICIGTGGKLLPPSGTELPENPRLFLFLDDGDTLPRLVIEAESGPLPYTVTKLPAPLSSPAFQIEVVAAAGSRFTLRVVGEKGEPLAASADYTVARLAPSMRAPISVESIESRVEGGCGYYEHSQHIRLSSSAAAAYRVEWADDAATFALGEKRSLVLPAALDDVDPSMNGVLRLGYVNCVGWTFAWKGDAPAFARFIALHVDGTEQDVSSEDGLIELSAPRPSRWRVFTENYLAPAIWRVREVVYDFLP